MKISTKSRNALDIMTDIALYGCYAGTTNLCYVSLKEVSSRHNITQKYLEQIVPLLLKSGFLISARGMGGGYALSRHPRSYTVGSILRAAEGEFAPVACLSENSGGGVSCERSNSCPTLPVWSGLKKLLDNYFDGITLESVVENFRDKIADGASDYCI